MKRNAHATVRSMPAILALALAFVSGCATGPTPEELERTERARLEQQARADTQRRAAEELQRQKAEHQRAVLARQVEVRSNAPGAQPSPQDVALASDLLVGLEQAAGKSLQTDSNPFFGNSDIKANTSPLFILDRSTGKLTIQLTQTERRELMLRNVREVRTNVNKFNLAILDRPPINSTSYDVILDMGKQEDAVILVDRNGTASWKNFTRVLATDAETASQIESSLKGLVAIYKK